MVTGSRRAECVTPSRARAQILPALVVLAALLALVLVHLQRRGREARADAPVAWIDPASARVSDAPSWADPRWLEQLSAVLAQQAPFPVDQGERLAALEEAVAALSFVERVERCELSAAGELALELSLREPVACIPVRGEYALVDEDGVVLEGRWPGPPRLGRASLPVLGTPGDPAFERARSGDWLVEREHLDALDVALSLAEHLGEEERAGLGEVVIDARGARRASASEPGVRLALEGARQALFGRAPGMDEPGELPAAAKWRSLARARELFERDPVGGDWELVDLRWDRPDLRLRHEPAVAALETDAPRARPGTTRARNDSDDRRPRVR